MIQQALRINNTNKACRILLEGSILGYPTEAVFGLGVDCTNIDAIKSLRKIKDRGLKGLIIITHQWSVIEPWVDTDTLHSEQIQQALKTWPGPYTWIMPASSLAPKEILGPDHTLAIRIPDHPICLEICEKLNRPIVSTSANPKGLEPARTTDEFTNYFNDIPVYDGLIGNQKKPSTIIDILSGKTLR